MNAIRFKSKEAFVAALEERRKFWQDYDHRQAREHKAAEREWLTNTRAKLREAVKWDYETLKNGLRYDGEIRRLADTPRCPSLMESRLDGVLAALEHTQGKTFTVDTRGTWAEAHNLLTWDPDARRTVC